MNVAESRKLKIIVKRTQRFQIYCYGSVGDVNRQLSDQA